jgi:hypothetical protein
MIKQYAIQLFARLDKDNSGSLTHSEVGYFCQTISAVVWSLIPDESSSPKVRKAADRDANIKAQLKMDYPHWRQFWDALDANDDGDITQPEMIDYMIRRYHSTRTVSALQIVCLLCCHFHSFLLQTVQEFVKDAIPGPDTPVKAAPPKPVRKTSIKAGPVQSREATEHVALSTRSVSLSWSSYPHVQSLIRLHSRRQRPVQTVRQWYVSMRLSSLHGWTRTSRAV